MELSEFDRIQATLIALGPRRLPYPAHPRGDACIAVGRLVENADHPESLPADEQAHLRGCDACQGRLEMVYCDEHPSLQTLVAWQADPNDYPAAQALQGWRVKFPRTWELLHAQMSSLQPAEASGSRLRALGDQIRERLSWVLPVPQLVPQMAATGYTWPVLSADELRARLYEPDDHPDELWVWVWVKSEPTDAQLTATFSVASGTWTEQIGTAPSTAERGGYAGNGCLGPLDEIVKNLQGATGQLTITGLLAE